MVEIDAFSLLEQHASLPPLHGGLKSARAQLARDAEKVLAKATEMHLTSLRDSLTDVSRAFQAVADAIDKHLAVFDVESSALKEKLKAMTVKQMDLDDIKKKQAAEANNVKDKRAGGQMYVPMSPWGGTTSTRSGFGG